MYTIQYFIDKFTAIPDENWGRGNLTYAYNPDKHCVLGHCGVRTLPDGAWSHTEEADALEAIYRTTFAPGTEICSRFMNICAYYVWRINDRNVTTSTPKQAVLAFLKERLDALNQTP